MARIAGINLPKDKRVEIGLTYIFGIGQPLADKILAQTKIDSNIRCKDLKEEEINILKNIIEKLKVEGELKREILVNIKRLKEINCYRGTRHSRSLPVRGQRTKTNSRTRRGNARKTMGSGRKNANEKT
ncbi:30S ribosomal protein S13 [Candidatus Kuenenbacteria bacterium HGW-Kuenenbacteria-1]|uniref:Small ribosomal subunit protein uS13 n=1 Tax=Candidatus Kuenenbacteria bacterium HGW-Kuenenbacteria-1 TaxID=2013812 RepID=A0A2N1UNI3_9BACT|nr:MAG: 30S ribosomal protein S13 [Candidatus Kuenenbacteria bacterium HGW-Kuenenbacteria-1]